MEGIVYDQTSGRIGQQRLVRDKKLESEWGSNYEVAILDPITLEETGEKAHTTDGKWRQLPDDDLRVIFFKLIKILHDADWQISAHCMNSLCDGYETEIDEHYLISQHDVFAQVRKLFGR